MLKPYPRRNLTVEERIANYCISRGRRISEQAGASSHAIIIAPKKGISQAATATKQGKKGHRCPNRKKASRVTSPLLSKCHASGFAVKKSQLLLMSMDFWLNWQRIAVKIMMEEEGGGGHKATHTSKGSHHEL